MHVKTANKYSRMLDVKYKFRLQNIQVRFFVSDIVIGYNIYNVHIRHVFSQLVCECVFVRVFVRARMRVHRKW